MYLYNSQSVLSISLYTAGLHLNLVFSRVQYWLVRHDHIIYHLIIVWHDKNCKVAISLTYWHEMWHGDAYSPNELCCLPITMLTTLHITILKLNLIQSLFIVTATALKQQISQILLINSKHRSYC